MNDESLTLTFPAAIKVEKTPKSIELILCLNQSRNTCDNTIVATLLPNDWDNLVLIKKGNHLEFDIILAYSNSNPEIKRIYLGNWNDGVK